MLETLLLATEYPSKFLICVLLAAIPTVVWVYLFGHRIEGRAGRLMLTFVGGMFSAVIILLYQYYWGQRLDVVFFSVEPQNFDRAIHSSILTPLLASAAVFLSIGFMEEYLKHWVVKRIDYKIFESIDEVIEYSIIAALGFAFLENVGYFFHLMVRENGENLISLFAMRSVFVVFIHVLCSGIYGYFYGLAHFAGPYLNSPEMRGKKQWLPELMYKLFHIGRLRTFRTEMMVLGLMTAMSLHGLYNLFMDMNLEVTMGEGGKVISLHNIVLPIILIVGYAYLSHLLDKKEYQKRYGHIVSSVQYSNMHEEIDQMRGVEPQVAQSGSQSPTGSSS